MGNGEWFFQVASIFWVTRIINWEQRSWFQLSRLFSERPCSHFWEKYWDLPRILEAVITHFGFQSSLFLIHKHFLPSLFPKKITILTVFISFLKNFIMWTFTLRHYRFFSLKLLILSLSLQVLLKFFSYNL